MFYYHKGLTRAARRTVATAITIAGRQGCTAVDTGHLLLAMLQTGRGTAVEFLRRKQITVTALSACASQRACTGRPLHLRGRDLAPESRKALEFAVLGAHAARVNKAENEHLLCAMLEDTACTASVWLAGLGLEVPRAARECRQLSGQLVLPSSPRMSSTRGSRPSEKYGRDLTRLAQEGQLDPVLCRDDELERMIEILCRRQKNNPCLLGEPGVGKSALAEALAQRIAAGQVTPSLKGKRVLALDMASMVAGTKYRGDFEERFKNLLEELYRDRSTILFIDEIHVIAGAGAAEGAIDAASILKPMLARGEIQLIGATTPEEYRKTIQKDSALDRRFGMVNIEEPAPQQAEKILTGLMPRYERYHGVRIPQEAIRAAVELSVRYAPSPSGRMHLGNLCCCLLAWLSAKSSGGKVVLRIEDLDAVRCPREFADLLEADLAWLGLAADEGGSKGGPRGPYYQSERSAIYEEYYQKLVRKGLVYPCFCSRSQLHAADAPHRSDGKVVYAGTCRNLTPEEIVLRTARRKPAWRVMVPDETISFVDGHMGPYAENLAQDCGDFYLRRADGVFAYQLAVVVDDALMGVTQVVRGADLLSSTPRQLWLYRELGLPAPEFYHMPLLLAVDGRRLSKRDGDESLEHLQARYTPEQIIGRLAYACGLQNAPDPRTPAELADGFSWQRVPQNDIILPEGLF